MQTILVAEDDGVMRQVLQDAVRDILGWQVALVASGTALLATLATQRPSLIVLDVHLPDR